MLTWDPSESWLGINLRTNQPITCTSAGRLLILNIWTYLVEKLLPVQNLKAHFHLPQPARKMKNSPVFLPLVVCWHHSVFQLSGGRLQFPALRHSSPVPARSPRCALCSSAGDHNSWAIPLDWQFSSPHNHGERCADPKQGHGKNWDNELRAENWSLKKRTWIRSLRKRLFWKILIGKLSKERVGLHMQLALRQKGATDMNWGLCKQQYNVKQIFFD